MSKTLVVSGFPGVGKSYLFENNPDLIVLDSDSSKFSWIAKGVRNKEFPKNYIEYIKSNIGLATAILVSSHKVVRDALREADINYTIVYPDKNLKESYIARYKDRGNGEDFIRMIEQNWDAFIDDIEAESYPEKIKLNQNEYLSDVFVIPPRMVSCSGLCTSQSDDYSGIHMSDERCIACDAIWENAHRENNERKSE